MMVSIMKKSVATLCLLLSATLGTSYLLAESDNEKAIRDSLSRAIPSDAIDQVSPSPMAGISEVLVGMSVYYVSNDGKYVFEGKLIDMDTRTDLTEERVSAVRQKTLASIDEKSMIVFPADKPRHTITVFTDIDCGYCRKLHNEMSEYNANGITVRYLSFPRSGPNSASFNKAVSVWCAKDRNAAMTSAKAGKDMPKKDCANPVKDHFDLGMQMGVAGTPAILMENGSLLPGYVPPKRLSQELDKQAATSS